MVYSMKLIPELGRDWRRSFKDGILLPGPTTSSGTAGEIMARKSSKFAEGSLLTRNTLAQLVSPRRFLPTPTPP